MIIEDVTGESFAVFMRREIAEPLGLSSLEWTWTPQIQAYAPMPYDERQKEVGYRQMACQAAGSEICTVSDFARFAAAAVSGPRGEPPGRGVLKPETVAAMLEVQQNADNGLAYAIGVFKGEKFLGHSGANPGWNAEFLIDINRRQGVSIANNSSLGASLNAAVKRLWLESVFPRAISKESGSGSRSAGK